MQVGSKCCEQAHSIIFSSDGCPVRQENASCAMRVPFMAEQNFSEGSGWRLGASAKILAMPSVSISALLSALQQKEKKKPPVPSQVISQRYKGQVEEGFRLPFIALLA